MLTIDSLTLDDPEAEEAVVDVGEEGRAKGNDRLDRCHSIHSPRKTWRQVCAANLICFYYLRCKKQLSPLKPWRRGNRQERHTHRILLCQIRYYPLIKRALSYILSAAIRRRFVKIRRGIAVLVGCWRRHRLPKQDPKEGSESDEEETNRGLDYLCPSPLVTFRGRALSTPLRPRKRLESDEALAAPLRKAPLVHTPLTTRTGAFRFVDEYSQDLLPDHHHHHNDNHEPSQPGTPLGTPPKREAPDPITVAEPVALSVIPDTHKVRPSCAKKRAQRVVRRNPRTSSATPSASHAPPSSCNAGNPARKLSEEAELASLTIQNTRTNSVYSTCELAFKDVIRKGERPASPSNRFAKSLAAAQRKWADLSRARDLTQRQWEQLLLEEKSPRKRKIKWSSHVSFIDDAEDDDEGEPSRDPLSAPSASRSALYDPRPTEPSPMMERPREKQLISVQRILYVPDKPNKKVGAKKTKAAPSR